MKLYEISQNTNGGYDTYDAFVVCAESKEKAKLIIKLEDDSWVTDIKYIKVKYLGEADASIKKGVILGSFNSG